ncbi:luciferin sulfotransferase-like [Chrysoperla carnea]|uniref:luciferin sulfotransferase-like n=1 Tax=Chrysoperla carnea TaxID=189513 RepID=UPI001D068FFF|nr:luciferin sulfotransferase-like [Chrysoperla carnea]
MSTIKYKTIDPNESNNAIDKNLYKYFINDFRKGYIEATDQKYVLPQYYVEFIEKIDNFEVYDTDVFVVTHPKTGTTWAQEMVWCIGNNLEVSDEYIYIRFPFLEVTTLFDLRDAPNALPAFFYKEFFTNSLEYIRKLPHPRFIKTHLPWELLPRQIRTGERKPKIIYVYRNPKDTCVSYYHHCVNGEGYKGDFNVFMELFLSGRLSFGPYPSHILSVVQQKHRNNVLILKYEEMKSDLKAVIKQVCEFLNKVYSEDDIDKLQKHLSFEVMKTNKAVNYDLFFGDGKFMRAGVIGSYKVDMSPDVVARFDKWIAENFANTGTSF